VPLKFSQNLLNQKMRSTRAKKIPASIENSETQINTNDPPKSEEDSASDHDMEDELLLDTDVTLPKGKFGRH
jgi:hypothetical protein